MIKYVKDPTIIKEMLQRAVDEYNLWLSKSYVEDRSNEFSVLKGIFYNKLVRSLITPITTGEKIDCTYYAITKALSVKDLLLEFTFKGHIKSVSFRIGYGGGSLRGEILLALYNACSDIDLSTNPESLYTGLTQLVDNIKNFKV